MKSAHTPGARAPWNNLDDIDAPGVPAAAFERVKEELAHLRPEEVRQLNVATARVVTTVLGAIPGLQALRARIASQLPTFDLVILDKLEDYAWALQYAQTLCFICPNGPAELASLLAEATALRAQFLTDMACLAQRGLLDAASLKRQYGPLGYEKIGGELHRLATAMEEAWPRLEGRTAATPDDLQRAFQLSARLFDCLALREAAVQEMNQRVEQRNRAFTLLVRVYDDCRHAVAYVLRSEGGVKRIAPSLYRRHRRSKARRNRRPHAAFGVEASL